MAGPSVFPQILDYASRANPYPLFVELRKTPIARQDDGSYVVSTYREILSLLHDPRISSDLRKRAPLDEATASAAACPARQEAASAAQTATGAPSSEELPPDFLFLDPPEHDRVRRLLMRQFGPPHTPGRVESLRGAMPGIVKELIDGLRDQRQIDITESFAYPFPVAVICELLGVPAADKPQLHALAEAIVAGTDPNRQHTSTEQRTAEDEAVAQLDQYMAQLVRAHAEQPGDDMLSQLITDDGPEGRLSPAELVTNALLLLIAGHETTVNLISNGMLTLLRHPAERERLRREPELVIPMVEELLRYEPPVQMLPQRTALAEITIAGTTIPKGVPVILALAAGNRDPDRFADPDRFIPDRPDNQHLGFGSGIHNCFGAPMARLEVQIALSELVRRLENPRLVEDPPPYKPNPFLRGPAHLLVTVDGVQD